MRLLQCTICASALLAAGVYNSLSAQRKKISAADYDNWNELGSVKISEDGKWFSWREYPQQGDGKLFIRNSETGKTDTIHRGAGLKFSWKGSFAIMTIEAQYEKVRNLKLAGKKGDALPKDSLAVFRLNDGKLTKYKAVKDFGVCKECDWFWFTRSASERLIGKRKQPRTLFSSKGNTLYIKNAESKKYKYFAGVTDVKVSEESGKMVYVTHYKKRVAGKMQDEYTMLFYDPKGKADPKRITASKFPFSQLSISDINGHFAFMETLDTSKQKITSLKLFNGGSGIISQTIDTANAAIPKGWCPSSEASIYFSKDETKVFFGVAPFPYKAPKDTLLADEKVKLDIWSWHDAKIQPEQLKSQRGDRNKAYLTVLHEDGKVVRLANQDMPQVRPMLKGDGPFALGVSNKEYERERNWEYPWKSDFYAVNVKSGERILLVQGNSHGVVMSPTGKYVVWYDGVDSTWYGKRCDDVGNAKGNPITKDANDQFSIWNNGSPYAAEPYGVVGWTKGEDRLVIRAEFDLWLCDPTGANACVNLTKFGKEEKISFNYLKLNENEEYIKVDSTIWVTGVNKITKDEGYYKLEPGSDVQAMLVSPHKYIAAWKADKGETVLFRRMNHHDFPNLWQTDGRLKTPIQVSDANPQQKDYAWGDVKMVSWTAPDGKEHQGLLYLPSPIMLPETTTVDSHPKYPMIVYYYEDYTDDIHNHNPPRPTASIVHPTEYISNGYVVFIPDIYYLPGQPGKSAYNSIMSGTDHVLALYPHLIDSTKMGLQGQSWGGYQTAWLITQTHRFKAAMAGAPVSNMVSAYGGIRWGSGMSRQFQYERTQSRIGYTIWDSLDLYIENSPVFHLPNVTAPLLIMHNDDDGAVPWYQGIEMYMGLRRLQKPVWMLNYNGEEHNLMKRANRKDLSLRMMQFFDYYLKNAPAPDWLINGLPATDKGRRMGYELIEENK